MTRQDIAGTRKGHKILGYESGDDKEDSKPKETRKHKGLNTVLVTGTYMLQ